MTGRNIVCFANDWDADPTSKHQVMSLLSRTNRVLWVNSIGLRKPSVSSDDASRILRKVTASCRGPVAVHENLHVLTPLAIPFHGSAWASAANAWWLGRQIRAVARRLGMTRFQLWTFLPTTAPLVRHLGADLVVYYCVDEWSAFSFLDAEVMRRMEQDLIAQSDLVIVSAQALYDAKRSLHVRTHLVPHGVDGEHFAGAGSPDTPVAPDLAGLRRPIIGFWGLIHEWVDLDLIQAVAQRHPEWSVALIGKAAVNCERLAALPNVHLLGTRPYSALPGYAKGFAAAMLPFKVNRLTESVNPIKLREYLAAGLPVVSTPLPEVASYSGVVRVGATADEFVASLEAAVQERGAEADRRRREAVAGETWAARVEVLSNLVEQIAARGADARGGGPVIAGAPARLEGESSG